MMFEFELDNRFVGSGQFCVKLCDNTVSTPDYCQNVYDLVGCQYNMPSNVQNGTFTSCEGENQDPVGIYVVGGVSKLSFLFFHFLFVSFFCDGPEVEVSSLNRSFLTMSELDLQTFGNFIVSRRLQYLERSKDELEPDGDRRFYYLLSGF